jgi:hypothetical protein
MGGGAKVCYDCFTLILLRDKDQRLMCDKFGRQ